MSDLDKVLALWQVAGAADEDYVLASIVRVEGSSYRKPGARMLITARGRRAGTISGGCLEAEVSKQAWWLTQNGPVMKAYSTSFEIDDEVEGSPDRVRPYGLGCGGVVHLLLERRATADTFLREAQRAFSLRQELACAVVLEGKRTGQRAFASSAREEIFPAAEFATLRGLAVEALSERESSVKSLTCEGAAMDVWTEYLPPRCGLVIFGAGDDAQPLVVQASTLGWHITVADGRSHLATPGRFPSARCVVLRDSDLSSLDLRSSDAAVVMTHSFHQDSNLLVQLLEKPLIYLGVLGPRYRTVDLVKHAVERIGGSVAERMQKLHAPVGFYLGGDSPATIALSILAEIQATLCKAQGGSASGLASQSARALRRQA